MSTRHHIGFASNSRKYHYLVAQPLAQFAAQLTIHSVRQIPSW